MHGSCVEKIRSVGGDARHPALGPPCPVDDHTGYLLSALTVTATDARRRAERKHASLPQTLIKEVTGMLY
jgi:hypothetical protein